MKKVFLGLALLAIVAVVVANVSLAGEGDAKEMSPDMQAYMKQYMAAIERAQPDPGDNPLAGMTRDELLVSAYMGLHGEEVR